MIRPPWEKYDRAKRSEGEAISDSERSLEKTEDVKTVAKAENDAGCYVNGKSTNQVPTPLPLGIYLLVGNSGLVAFGFGKFGIAYLFMGINTFAGVFLTLLLVLLVLSIYGLFKRARWAFKLTKGLYLTLLLWGGVKLLSSVQQGLDVTQAIDFAITLWIYLYLRMAKVQALFEPEARKET